MEVCLVDRLHDVDAKKFGGSFYNRVRGILGMEITFRGEIARIAPTQMLAANLSFRRAVERFLVQRSASLDDLVAEGGLRAFPARQFLLPASPDGTAVELFRGCQLVNPNSRGIRLRAAALASAIGTWMLRNLSTRGELPYKYWPSRGTVSPADNAIRQFLASLALARLGKIRRSAEICDAARRNLRFNLGRYFTNIGGGRGAIVERTGAKLGAAAVAALAIVENPSSGEFVEELEMLATGINSLTHDELGFRTFFFPEERDGENWNFYSGEALLFWAEAARRGFGFVPSMERCAAVFECCRARHYKEPNPAFVPWHTQACASFFAQTGRRGFADFALEISDWLLPMQQWDGLPSDMRGRFYDPHRPEFGPPHAASTGAYMEGLAEAVALARALGDQARASAYELAIARGLRSLRQLQFRNDVDSCYISKKNRVLGALRTEVYDNSLRVDSAAHALLAAIKVLSPREFG
ncbi:MAG: hypothetical protein OXC19_08520 [Bryobacterales bacterium]|nr:hypothetical protein [Bryobacterales bacterium]